MDNQWIGELCFELWASGPSGLSESLFKSRSQQRDRGNSGRSSRMKPDAAHTAAGRSDEMKIRTAFQYDSIGLPTWIKGIPFRQYYSWWDTHRTGTVNVDSIGHSEPPATWQHPGWTKATVT